MTRIVASILAAAFNVPTPPLNAEIPNDFQHLHFGAGQTEAEISLTPGEHTLQLVFGDKDHIPHSPPVVSARIKVKVVEQTNSPAQAKREVKRHPSPKDVKVHSIQPSDGASRGVHRPSARRGCKFLRELGVGRELLQRLRPCAG